MKRKLITQMRNEWRSNIWMTTELVIVGVVLCAIFSVFACLIYVRQPPKGIDFNDIYVGNLGCVPPSASSYQPYADSLHNAYTDLEMLLVNLRNNPLVENAGTGDNAIPYEFNYYGSMLWSVNPGDTLCYEGNVRSMDPDMVRTLRIEGVNGESPEQLAELVGEGKFLISTIEREPDEWVRDPELFVGHEAHFDGDTLQPVEVAAIFNGIRRADFEPLRAGVIIRNIPEDFAPNEIAVRVKPGKGREFMETLDPATLRFGNVYVTNLIDIDERKAAAHLEFTNMMRNLSVCALFLMVAVFLGILGSFWYRTQQRIPELALRKVNGATDRDIFRRFLSEGLMLLAFAAPVIAGTIWLFVPVFGYEFADKLGAPLWLVWAAFAFTVVALAAMICAGIAFPAGRAMKVKPAEALKDQ